MQIEVKEVTKCVKHEKYTYISVTKKAPTNTIWIRCKDVSQLKSLSPPRWLINYKRHQSKTSSSKKLTCKWTLRQVFIRVYRLEIQSVMLVFSTQLCELSCLGGVGRCWVLLETIFCRSFTLCFWPDSEPTKLLDRPKQKNRWGEGLRQVNTCRKVPLQVNFFRWRHSALVSI